MTVIGTDQYEIPPVVPRIISVSEININLLGVPTVPLAATVGRALHQRDGARGKMDEHFTFSVLCATVRLELGQAAKAEQVLNLISWQF